MSNLKKDPSQVHQGSGINKYAAGKLQSGKIEIVKQKVVNTGGLDVPEFTEHDMMNDVNQKLDQTEKYNVEDKDSEVKYRVEDSPSKTYAILGKKDKLGNEIDPKDSG